MCGVGVAGEGAEGPAVQAASRKSVDSAARRTRIFIDISCGLRWKDRGPMADGLSIRRSIGLS